MQIKSNVLHTAYACSTDVFITYIGTASPTSTIGESMNPVNTTLVLLIVFGIACGLTLLTVLVLVSCLLHLRIKRKQKSSEFRFVAQLHCYQL